MKMRDCITTGLVLIIGAGRLLAAESETCGNNMAQLDAVIQQYAHKNKIEKGQQIPAAELQESFLQYMKRDLKNVKCPAGGNYTFGTVGGSPTCTVHGSLVDVRSAIKRERETHARSLRISDSREDTVQDGAKDGSIAEWSALELTLSSLQTQGTREYSFSSRSPGEKTTVTIGSVTLATEITSDTVILRDSYQMIYKGKKMSLDMVHTCRKDKFLSPIRIESKGEGNDEFATFVAMIADRKMTVRSKGLDDSVSEFPDGVITMSAMLRLATLLPKKPGSVYTYKYSLESSELNLKKQYRLTVLPPETITCNGQEVMCSKFQVAGGGIHPIYYWVNKQGLLQRVLIDDQKIMELKEAASN